MERRRREGRFEEVWGRRRGSKRLDIGGILVLLEASS
jgi:hypothetical protein